MDGLSRRDLLKGAAGAALGTVASAVGARAQVTGVTPGGGAVPFRLPMGALPYLDRNQYVHNMEIHAFVPGPETAGGEPLMNLWAKGRQRFLPADGGWLDITEPTKPVAVKAGSTRLRKICVAYNTALRKWIALESVEPPMPRHTPEYPRGQHHREWVEKTTLAYKGLRGFRTYDITDPARPVLLQEFDTGRTGFGTHTNFYDGGKYAFLDCGWDDQLRMENPQRPSSNGIMIVDMTDPASVKEMSRWWVPGQRIGEEEEYKKYWFAGDQSSWTGVHGAPTVPKRIEDGGRYGYGGFGHFGMFVFDFSDVRKPKPAGRLMYDFETIGGIPYHSVAPVIADAAHPQLQDIVIGMPETIYGDCREPFKTPYLISVKDAAHPRVIGRFPRPVPPKEAPYADFCQARGRFGTHNIQAWLAPGTARPEIAVITWFNAGVRIHDISDPTQPRELAYFVPRRTGEMDDYMSWYRGTSENVFVEWDRNLIWIGTHEGTYCLSSPALGKPVLEPRRIDRWTVPHGNRGWDDQTPTSVYFGRSRREFLGL
ncbi:MAG TPA: hypothetical protein VK886_20405 [Vicinamibacterales bacterium]|nr:hypothetical protein [Vicinamibacterales bacterium]